MTIRIRIVRKPSLARAPHDTEMVNFDDEDFDYIPNTNNISRVGVIREVVRRVNNARPEVYRLLPLHHVLLTEPLQKLWKDLNPDLSGEKWATLLGDDLAWTNGTGFGGDEPKIDYVNKRNLDAEKPPAFDQARFCGGHTFHVDRVEGNRAYLRTLRVDRPLPKASELLANPNYHHLWYWGTSISPTGRIQKIPRLGLDGTLKFVRVPLYTNREVYVMKSELHWLPEPLSPTFIVHR